MRLELNELLELTIEQRVMHDAPKCSSIEKDQNFYHSLPQILKIQVYFNKLGREKT